MTESTQRQKILWILGTILVLFYALVPVLWIISLSLKDPTTIGDQKFFPTKWTWDNYDAVFSGGLGFNHALFNSIGIAMITTLIALVFASMAAYAITRLEFPGKTAILAGALAISMFPAISIVGGLFNVWRVVGLYDTWPGLILPYLSFSLPLSIYILSAFFRGASQFTDPSGAIAAGAVVVTIPILIMVLIFQRRIVSGLTSGAVKG